MATTFSTQELATEAGLPVERVDWLVRLGILTPRDPGPFRFGDVFRVKLVAALLNGGFTPEQVEWAVSEGHLDLDRVDEYQVIEPGPRSTRTFAEFWSRSGPGGGCCQRCTQPWGSPPRTPRPTSPSMRRSGSAGSCTDGRSLRATRPSSGPAG